MKTKITLLLLFIGFVSKANFVQGTILFNDGHSETGFIKSFLEDKLLNNPLGSLEDNLNLNDKTLKFKTSEKGEVRKIKIDDINEVTLIQGNYKQEFKVLYLKEINRKGQFEDSKTKVCLPLVKKGKVNIYGFTYDHTSSDGKYVHRYRDVAYYYQNANENYAFNYYDFDIQDFLSFKQRFFNPLKELFKDCPDMVTYVNGTLIGYDNLTKEEKAKAKEDYKKHAEMLKMEYKDVPADVVNGNLDVFHKFKRNPMDDLINRYNECK